MFEVSIERGEEDSPADIAEVFQYARCSINKVSSEDHQGGRFERFVFGFRAHLHLETDSYF